jgi:hypothetical protein
VLQLNIGAVGQRIPALTVDLLQIVSLLLFKLAAWAVQRNQVKLIFGVDIFFPLV